MSNDYENGENIKSCIILCGGKSSRMGQDKGSMIIQDKPMIKHILATLNHQINEAIIVLNDTKRIERYSEFINPKDYAYKITFVSASVPIFFRICERRVLSLMNIKSFLGVPDDMIMPSYQKQRLKISVLYWHPEIK